MAPQRGSSADFCGSAGRSRLRRLCGRGLVLAVATTPSLARALDVQPTSDATSLAQAVLANPQFTLGSATFYGENGAAAVFGTGPLGSGSGALLTTGLASNVMPPNDSPATTTAYGTSGVGYCDSLVNGAAFDPVKLHFEVSFNNTFDTLRIPVVFASEEYPESSSRTPSDIGAIYVNGILVGQFDAAAMAQAAVYGAATESELDAAAAFVIDAPSVTGVNTVDIVLCDGGDASYDSALFIGNILPCYDGVCGTVGPCGIVDLDSDGESACTDCDDSDPAINALAVEICNGKDDDCDGATDDNFNVGIGCAVGVGACYALGHYACVDATSTACDAVAGIPQPEQCGDGIDSDCDGAIDPPSGCSGSGSGGGGAASGGGSPGSGGGGESASGGSSGSGISGGESAGGGQGSGGGLTSGGGAEASGGGEPGGGSTGSGSAGAPPSGGHPAQGGSGQGASAHGGSSQGGSGGVADSGGSNQGGGLDGTSVLDDTLTGGGCGCDTAGAETTRTSIGAIVVLVMAALKRRRKS